MGQILHYSLSDRAFFLLVGVVGSFVEESLWRGNLLPVLEKRFGAATALLLVSVLFALYHLNFRPGSLIFKTTAGLIYGSLYLRNRGLVSPALAQALSWTPVGNL